MSAASQRRALGAIQILGSGLAFGFLGIFGKASYKAGLTPGEFLALRFGFAAVMMWMWASVAPGERKRPSARLLLHCAILGALGYAVFSSCYFIALKGLSASLTVLLLYAYPPLVAIGAWIAFRERPSTAALIAMPFAGVGMILLVWGDMRADNLSSIAFGLAAAVFYSVYILASSRWLKDIDSLTSARWVQTFAAIALFAMNFRSPARVAETIAVAWPSLIGVAAISTVGAMALFLAGLSRLKSSEASILSLAEPISAVALSALFLDERLTILQLCGGAVVLGSLAAVAAPRRGGRGGPRVTAPTNATAARE